MGRTSLSLVVLRLLAMCLALIALPGQPALAKSDWDYEWVWYTPKPSTDVDEAAKTLTNLQPFFSNYGGMMIDRMVITRSGIAVHASQTTIQQRSQYVPSYGGSWIGGTYVPYYGGSTVTQQVPVTSEAQVFVSFADLVTVQLLRFPKLGFSWGVHFAHQDPAKNVTLRTSDEGLARQFADAASILAVSANPGLIGSQDFLGFEGAWDDAKAAKKARWTAVKGYFLTDVAIGSPAGKAGLRKGDIVFESNGKPVSSESRFFNYNDYNIQNEPEVVFDLKVFRNRQVVPVRLVVPNVALLYRLAVNPPRLGIGMGDPTAEQLAAQGFAAPKGVIVRVVHPGTLAARMDFRPGDWVLELNGQSMTDSKALGEFVAANQITGAKVLRGGMEVSLVAPGSAAVAPASAKLGLNVRELTDSTSGATRLEVVSVVPGSLAAQMEFQPGDLLIEANGKAIARTSDLTQIVAVAPLTEAKVERAGKIVALAVVTSL
ncbi:MAG: PDZ domain-containing protein [Novosphingobium sp.]